MNNQQANDPSLVSIQNELIGESPTSKSKSSIRENIIIIFICLVLSLFFFWVYYRWMSIPVKKHDINIEYLASSQEEAYVDAFVNLTDYKNFNIDVDLSKELNKHDGSVFETPTLGSTISMQQYGITIGGSESKSKAQMATPRIKNYSTDTLSSIIGHKISKELEVFCNTNNLKLSDFQNLFYLRHFENENSSKKIKHKILGSDPNSIIVSGRNDFAFSNHLNPCRQSYERNIDKKSLSKLSYRNITESLFFTKDGSVCPYEITAKAPNKLIMLLWKSIQLEDITQSYYIIRLYSSDIKTLSLQLNFFSTINCIPFNSNKSFIDVEHISIGKTPDVHYVDKEDEYMISKTEILSGAFDKRYTSDNRSIRIWTTTGYANLKCLVKFNDMENIQTMRLFILAAFFTLTLTTMIKSIWKIRKVVFLGITKNSKTLWKKTVTRSTKFKKKINRSQKKQS